MLLELWQELSKDFADSFVYLIVAGVCFGTNGVAGVVDC